MSTSVSSVRDPAAGPGRSASPCLESPVRHFRNVHDGLDAVAEPNASSCGTNTWFGSHRLHDREHEGAAGRVRLHQAADVDIALGDDARERRHHALVVLLLLQDLQLRLLRRQLDCATETAASCAFKVCTSIVPCCASTSLA